MAITLAQLQARVDAALLAQLTDYENGAVVDEVKVGHALTDAEGIIEGYLFKLDDSQRPPTATLDAHEVALALAILAGNRPGEELDSIRSRSKAAIHYLEGLAGKAVEPLGMSSDAPDALMTDEALSQFGSLEVVDASES